ncbi:MAG: hypothetical protein JJ902_05430 [Roseibium sp.]|nr:hypothetical protein [Roseibium sp.]
MKTFRVKIRTLLLGQFRGEGYETKLTEDHAKPYLDGGLIEEVKPETDKKAPKANASAKTS